MPEDQISLRTVSEGMRPTIAELEMYAGFLRAYQELLAAPHKMIRQDS